MALIALVLIYFGVQVREELSRARTGGTLPLSRGRRAGMIVSIPLTLPRHEMILPVIMAICLMTMICGHFPPEPKLDDAVPSMLLMLGRLPYPA